VSRDQVVSLIVGLLNVVMKVAYLYFIVEESETGCMNSVFL